MGRLAWIGCVVLPFAALCGCKQAADLSSPEKTFAAFDAALKGGDSAAAAELVDYDYLAQQGNEDLGTAAKQQQKLITDKMREDTAKGLGSMGYPSGGMQAGPAQVSGEQATITAQGEGKSLTLQFRNGGDGWKIVGGIPGMTTTSGMK
ncbi:MAG: hypothetical protein HYU66_06980 [Armatimonadetes bacterium]|nr:hypothetical protein [Armatimonadota bacterium]